MCVINVYNSNICILLLLLTSSLVTEGLIYSITAQRATALPQKLKQQQRKEKENYSDSDYYSIISRSPLEYRIRTTREDDIDEIASLLSATAENGSNWKAKIENLRRLQCFKENLKTRYKSLCEGKRAFKRVRKKLRENYNDDEISSIPDMDQLRYLWNENQVLRESIRKASFQSNEPHPWKEHNFATCPPEATYLQHAMITVEHARLGHIVGFCEVGMILPPSGSDANNVKVYPTIANLVTAKSYRRRGIGKTLLESVKKYVRIHWNADQIALYVKKSNDEAKSLYAKQGYEELCSIDDTDECYMTIDTAEQASEELCSVDDTDECYMTIDTTTSTSLTTAELPVLQDAF